MDVAFNQTNKTEEKDTKAKKTKKDSVEEDESEEESEEEDEIADSLVAKKKVRILFLWISLVMENNCH